MKRGKGKAPTWDSEFLWPNPMDGPWHIKLAWRDTGERVECVGVSIEEWDYFWRVDAPPHVITAKLMRDLPIGRLVQEHREIQAKAAEIYADFYLGEGDHETYQSKLRHAETLRARGETLGRPRMYGDDHYEAVAAVYSGAWRAGNKKPTDVVRQTFGVSASTAARWVRECRSRNHLGRTTQGKAGGILPPEEKEDSL